ncbi:hypothetical protein MHA_0764 [Mannheimia haemolytica PHL213]|nr:hypothetical protein MHA_0764 [Mannheimia haemolytica PHL213]
MPLIFYTFLEKVVLNKKILKLYFPYVIIIVTFTTIYFTIKKGIRL